MTDNISAKEPKDQKVSYNNSVLLLRVIPLCALPFIIAVAAPVNLISNGSFESGGMTPWFQNTDGVRPSTCGMPVCELWNATQAVSHSGKYSATDVGNLEMRQDFAPVPTLEIDQLGFWMMNPNTYEAVIGYELFYADDPHPIYYFNAFIDFLPNSDWKYIDMTGHLLHGAQLVGIGISGSDRFPSTPAPRLFVDDVVLSATLSAPEASSSALVGAGAFALMALALRRRTKRSDSL